MGQLYEKGEDVVLRIFGNSDVNPAERRKCCQPSKIYV